MREIKYRAWNVEDASMISWEEMRLEKDEEDTSLSVLVFEDSMGSYFDYFPLMQFTGFKDKHGNEIYVGDIVKRVDDIPFISEDGTKKCSTWTVAFEYGGWAFKDTPASPATSYPSFYSNAKYMEVIGNLYENPEYMKKQVTA